MLQGLPVADLKSLSELALNAWVSGLTSALALAAESLSDRSIFSPDEDGRSPAPVRPLL